MALLWFFYRPWLCIRFYWERLPPIFKKHKNPLIFFNYPLLPKARQRCSEINGLPRNFSARQKQNENLHPLTPSLVFSSFPYSCCACYMVYQPRGSGDRGVGIKKTDWPWILPSQWGSHLRGFSASLTASASHQAPHELETHDSLLMIVCAAPRRPYWATPASSGSACRPE